MAKKIQYHYIATQHNFIKENGELGTSSMSVLCKSEDDKNHGGIPTMGYLIKEARKSTEAKGWKFVEESLFIISIIKLTKEQYVALNDKTEPEDKE